MFGRLKRILLTCPACGHKQEESQFARSTFCRDRGCGTCFQIEDGAAVPLAPPSAYPFPTRGQRVSRSPDRRSLRPGGSPRKPSSNRETQLEFFSSPSRSVEAPSTDLADAPRLRVTTSSGDHPAIARMARLLPEVPRQGHRHVHCLECDFPQSIPELTLSTMCLRCTAPIPLRDYDLREMRHRRIRTRGNVHVHRKGGICGVPVQCNDLTIEGEFTGSSIDCDGDLKITRDCAIKGSVRCRRLFVQGRAEVSFEQPVQAREVVIDGTVRGNIVCDQLLHLEKNSLLEGDIEARSLSISEGACHAGNAQKPQMRERYAKFGELHELQPPPEVNRPAVPAVPAVPFVNPFVAVGKPPGLPPSPAEEPK